MVVPEKKDVSASVAGKEDYNAMTETLQILSIPGMLERIEEARTTEENDLIPLEKVEW